MVATPAQIEAIGEMKARHREALAQFDLWCEERRLELTREHDMEFDRFYSLNGGRRDRSINEGRRPTRSKGEQDGTST